jgi:hypothetical protein
LKAARHHPTWSPQHAPLFLSKLQNVQQDLKILRELVPDLDQLIATRKQAFKLHEEISEAIQNASLQSRTGRTSLDSPAPFNAGPIPQKLAAIPQRLYDGASPSIPSRSLSPRGRAANSDRRTAPTSSPGPSILGQYAPGLTSPGSGSPSRPRVSGEIRRVSSGDGQRAEMAPQALLDDVVETANSAALAKRIKFPIKSFPESKDADGHSSSEETEDEDASAFDGSYDDDGQEVSREASLGHILTNVVILQEFVLELVAIIQVRASMFGEVRFA